ncbi:M24 family metallopeptidase [Moorella sp. ACPs]|uniref:M24 family metallopeptidase n=1 Tax=Neomoorella carbonis TaxID=3062783 RepID=UPI00324A2D77
MEEWKIKQQKVREFLRAKDLAAFIFSRRSSFAWLTDGGESSVNEASIMGDAHLVITPERLYVTAPNNEMDRLLSEVLGDQGYEPLSYYWWENGIPTIEKLFKAGRVGSDMALPGCLDLYQEVKRLRYSLMPGEQERMRILGKRAADILSEVCRQIHPGDSEIKIAGEVKGKMGAEGIATPVVLVAADDRINRYRHPLPTEKEVERLVMVVVCARRWGLTVALTRMVHFGSVPRILSERFQEVNTILARLINATTPGKPVKEIFSLAMQTYAELGYPHEWQSHHQGGPIGYDTREYLASPECDDIVLPAQGFAWNPTLPGVKAEDTILVSEAAQEILTVSKDWPTQIIKADRGNLEMPDILTL